MEAVNRFALPVGKKKQQQTSTQLQQQQQYTLWPTNLDRVRHLKINMVLRPQLTKAYARRNAQNMLLYGEDSTDWLG